MENEIWKAIEGYEGKYEVSNLGRVRSLDREIVKEMPQGKVINRYKGRLLNPSLTRFGYMCINLSNKQKKLRKWMVHVLVAKAFVSGYFDGADVNHIDENKTNNRADNLEWCTRKQNINHGTHNERATAHCVANRKAIVQMSLSGEVIATYPHGRAAEAATGVKRYPIVSCCKGRYGFQTAGGYRWRYADENDK